MRKLQLILLLMLLSKALCMAVQTDWQVLGLKGKVQIMEEESSATLFSENGYITLCEIGGRTALYSTVTYVYDSESRLLTREQTDDSGTVLNADYYTYDESGMLNTHKDFSLSYTNVYNYSYNDKQQVAWKKNIDYYGMQVQAIEYFYDADGNVAKENYYNRDMKLSHYMEYRYDKQGNLLESQTKEPNNKLIRKFVYKYSSKNQRIEETITQEKKIAYKINTRYDDQGNILERITYEPDSNRTTKQTHQYVYDEQGNWTNHTLFLDSNLQSEETRSFTYFDE